MVFKLKVFVEENLSRIWHDICTKLLGWLNTKVAYNLEVFFE